MNWEDERYVRLYTRDTADLLAVGWEGRLVFYELLRRVDRAGVIDFGADPGLLAELLRVPHDVCEVGLERLVTRGAVEVADGHAVVPNFIEAQEARQSDAQRQRESRARRRDRVRSQTVTPAVTERDQGDPNGDETSHAVTRGHTESHGVTPSLAVPSCDESSRTQKPQPSSDLSSEVRSGIESLPPEALKLADWLRKHILEAKPTHAIGKGETSDTKWRDSVTRRKWAVTADRMHRIDKRDYRRSARLVVWLFGDNLQREVSFVVESMDALRDKWDRVDAAERKARAA